MTLDERIALIGAVPEFAGLPAAARATLAAAMREERFVAGERILGAGEPADRIFLIAEGAAEVTRLGATAAARRLGRGALMGELGFFAEDIRTATVVATRDCALLSLPYPNFRALLLAHPEGTLALAGRIVRSLVEVEAQLAAADRR